MMENEKAEIAGLAAKYGRVQSLMRYVNKETLAKSYSQQPKGKAVGVDGVRKETYGENLNENLDDLLKRMRQFSYRPYPVRRAYIPKGNGKMRGLGIPSFEDKVVQGVFKEILEGIYADDFVCLFQYEQEVKRFYRMLEGRMKKFGLELAEDKSRIMPFGRYKGTKESFDFLGFTHYNGKSHWGKYCVLHRTSKKKLKQKRQSAKEWLREHMHESIPETVGKLNKKLVGHYRYYGIYGNWISLKKFYSYVKYELWRTKRRRDQSCWLTWGKFKENLRIYPIVWPKVYLTSAY